MMTIQTDQRRTDAQDWHAARYPRGCTRLCAACAARLGIANETDEARARRTSDAIARFYGHEKGRR